MKKIIFLFVIIILLVIFSSNDKSLKEKEEVKAVFFSYIELSKYVKNSNQEISKSNIRKIIKKIKDYNLNTIILQVRVSSDSIYNSKLFPTSMYIVEKEGEDYYDVLDYFIKESHKNKLKLYAWINPYRVRTTNDINSISKNNPAYKYIGTDTLYINNSIYYNPSKKEVENLIIDGVKEVLDYDIDGLLFDDYFYPDNSIDIEDYKEYIKNNKNITVEEYHLKVINSMVKKVYKECKDKNIYFGISPEGNIENNYNKNYADVKRWMSESNYIDFIMPQIYYGFYNGSRNYIDTIKEWESLNKNVDLMIALAFYKIGTIDNYAKEGKNEWVDSKDIIMREVLLARNLKKYKGFSIFRYDSIFDKDNYQGNTKIEKDNLKRVIK